MVSLLLLLLAPSFPSTSATGWMEPAAFHLRFGMNLDETRKAFRGSGHSLGPAGSKGEWIVDYEDGKSITLVFVKGRLQSIRFELVDFIPRIREAFREYEGRITRVRGTPTTRTGSILIYEEKVPQIYVVVSTDSSSSFGRKGLGFLAVRYFVPAASP
ncbi:MAG TPA: hypothetical protein VM534_02605 [Thermoanaerobaculia bacterium]|nr:hypothetical protein [Thermoanaerobaculia bacterium]